MLFVNLSTQNICVTEEWGGITTCTTGEGQSSSLRRYNERLMNYSTTCYYPAVLEVSVGGGGLTGLKLVCRRGASSLRASRDASLGSWSQSSILGASSSARLSPSHAGISLFLFLSHLSSNYKDLVITLGSLGSSRMLTPSQDP